MRLRVVIICCAANCFIIFTKIARARVLSSTLVRIALILQAPDTCSKFTVCLLEYWGAGLIAQIIDASGVILLLEQERFGGDELRSRLAKIVSEITTLLQQAYQQCPASDLPGVIQQYRALSAIEYRGAPLCIDLPSVWTLNDEEITYRFSLTDEPRGSIEKGNQIKLPSILLHRILQNPNDPPLRFTPTMWKEGRIPRFGKDLIVVLATPRDRKLLQGKFICREETIFMDLPYETPRGPCLPKEYARVIALGLQQCISKSHPARWRVDVVRIVDDDITYSVDNDLITENGALYLQMREMLTSGASAVTMSPKRNKKWSKSITMNAKRRDNVFTWEGKNLFFTKDASRLEHSFLVRTTSLERAYFVPQWFTQLRANEWRLIRQQLDWPTVKDSIFEYRHPNTQKIVECNLWRTVFFEGEDFGLGMQIQNCSRLLNVYTLDERNASAAGTSSVTKRDFMFLLPWRSLVGSRLLVSHPQTPLPTRQECAMRLPYYDGGCDCPGHKPCHFSRKKRCPCLAWGLNCDNCNCYDECCDNKHIHQ